MLNNFCKSPPQLKLSGGWPCFIVSFKFLSPNSSSSQNPITFIVSFLYFTFSICIIFQYFTFQPPFKRPHQSMQVFSQSHTNSLQSLYSSILYFLFSVFISIYFNLYLFILQLIFFFAFYLLSPLPSLKKKKEKKQTLQIIRININLNFR